MEDANRCHYYEPQEFSAGDSIYFRKFLGQWLPSNGWSLTYEMRGGALPIQWLSVPDVDEHVITIPTPATQAYAPLEYELTGYAVNAGKNERHQFYQNVCRVTPNLIGAAGDINVKTFYQQMVEKYQVALLKLADSFVLESDIEGTRILRQKRAEITAEYQTYYRLRQNEIDQQRAKDGLPSRNAIHPRLLVSFPGPIFGEQWPVQGAGPFWPNSF